MPNTSTVWPARRLRAADEAQLPSVAEIGDDARQPVGLEVRVAVDQRDDALRLGLEQVAAGDHAVAADVVDAAAADVGHVAHVLRVVVVVEERAAHQVDAAQFARAHDLAGAVPLRVVAHHEGFGDQRCPWAPRAALRLPSAVMRDGLFAQHVLAGARRAPASSARAGDWAADCRSRRYRGRRTAPHSCRRRGRWRCPGQQRRLRAAEVARSDGDDFGMLRLHDGRVDLRHADIGGRNDPPANFARACHDCSPSFAGRVIAAGR